jgi:hypothetical protein
MILVVTRAVLGHNVKEPYNHDVKLQPTHVEDLRTAKSLRQKCRRYAGLNLPL